LHLGSITLFSVLLSASAAAAQQDLVPPERQAEYSRIVSDLFVANACAKRWDFPHIYGNATQALVIFAEENKFPDARSLVKTTAAEISKKVDATPESVTNETCAELAVSSETAIKDLDQTRR